MSREELIKQIEHLLGEEVLTLEEKRILEGTHELLTDSCRA